LQDIGRRGRGSRSIWPPEGNQSSKKRVRARNIRGRSKLLTGRLWNMIRSEGRFLEIVEEGKRASMYTSDSMMKGRGEEGMELGGKVGYCPVFMGQWISSPNSCGKYLGST
jgi:hypothetical protein